MNLRQLDSKFSVKHIIRHIPTWPMSQQPQIFPPQEMNQCLREYSPTTGWLWHLYSSCQRRSKVLPHQIYLFFQIDFREIQTQYLLGLLVNFRNKNLSHHCRKKFYGAASCLWLKQVGVVQLLPNAKWDPKSCPLNSDCSACNTFIDFREEINSPFKKFK